MAVARQVGKERAAVRLSRSWREGGDGCAVGVHGLVLILLLCPELPLLRRRCCLCIAAQHCPLQSAGHVSLVLARSAYLLCLCIVLVVAQSAGEPPHPLVLTPLTLVYHAADGIARCRQVGRSTMQQRQQQQADGSRRQVGQLGGQGGEERRSELSGNGSGRPRAGSVGQQRQQVWLRCHRGEGCHAQRGRVSVGGTARSSSRSAQEPCWRVSVTSARAALVRLRTVQPARVWTTHMLRVCFALQC